MFFMQAPDLKQTFKDPLPLIKKRRWQMARKMRRGQRREEKKAVAKLRKDKKKKELARKKRKGQREVRQAWKREENRARQLDQTAASSEKKTCLPTKKAKAQPQRGLPESVRKILMAATYRSSAGKRSMSEKADREQKQAERRKEKEEKES